MRAVIDTNILIDYLSGVEAARGELDRHRQPSISQITWMDVLVGARDDGETGRLKSFLSGFDRVAIDDQVSEIAVGIRQRTRIRLPDAIVWASAQRVDGLLVTRNVRDFPRDDPAVRVPYVL